MGIHPGLHAEGVYEFWEPTLELLLDQNIKTIFTVLNEEEYTQSLERLDNLFCKYLYKGKNPFASRHVKQTPHDPELMWASNQYIIVIKVKKHSLRNNNRHSDLICYRYLLSYVHYNLAFQGRTVDLKTLTLIEEPAAGDEIDNADEEFERILRESGEQ